MLQFLDRHGMIVGKVYEILCEKQSKWLESFMTFNLQKRKQAINDFDKNFLQIIR